MIAIVKKEVRTYFSSLIGYIFLAGFLFLLGMFFVDNNLYFQNTNFVATLARHETLYIFLIIIPLLTMQLFSEEQKLKTDQLLFSSSIGIGSIVLGKYFGALILFLVALVLSLALPFMLSLFGNIVLGQTISMYIGFALLGMAFISIGLFIACLSKSPVISAIVSFVAIYLFFVIDSIALSMPMDRLSSALFLGVLAFLASMVVYDATKNLITAAALFGTLISAGVIIYFVEPTFYDAAMPRILLWLSLLSRLSEFGAGIFNISHILFYLTFSAVFIYLTVNTIEKRRWR